MCYYINFLTDSSSCRQMDNSEATSACTPCWPKLQPPCTADSAEECDLGDTMERDGLG